MKIVSTLLLLCAVVATACAKPVSFVFEIPHNKLNPYLREIWADVSEPDGRTLHLPAFYAGGTYYAVRVRPDQAGSYKIGSISEGAQIQVKSVSPVAVVNTPENAARYQKLPQVGIDPKNARRFACASGAAYFPIGANLAWPTAKPPVSSAEFNRDVFRAFATHDLNWTRVWMCHWAGQNLDWLPDHLGESPPPGVLNPRVADTWDAIIDVAEENHIYLQLVLQHHGQYSTGENSNWAVNPWNAANKNGFLKTPTEFFSLADARYLTRLKYRYIIARWGYSPAILAWELFNEVNWVDAMSTVEGRTAIVAWHAEMADAIRSFDSYRHLITSSNDDVRIDINDRLDFRQVHLYARNMIDAVRQFEPARTANTRTIPVFYGETGDDHLPGGATVSGKKTVERLIAPLWASLFAEGEGIPAQTWYAERLLDTDRLNDLASLARFANRAHLAKRSDTVSFSPAVEAADAAAKMPMILRGGQNWHRQSPPDIEVAFDGSEPASVGRIPEFIVGGQESIADKFPHRVAFHINRAAPTNARLVIANTGTAGAALRVTLDDDDKNILAERTWPGAISRSEHIALTVPAGKHSLTLTNTGGNDWFEFGSLEFDHSVSKIAALGRRANDLIVLWFWHRENVYASARKPGASASATVVIPDLPAGRWRVTWWDTAKGSALKPENAAPSFMHSGGDFRLATVPVLRHTAVILELEREP